ncbi:MAG: hypothetical protein A2Y95_11635 [Deltaproteobacteria bacterium RBG_13_65_10]|jgi:hypothetical protein|nr:MAG: hypothetical protein A2Y95_11635 [Deltaproteobacteria bacterium RBG_13_65_10]
MKDCSPTFHAGLCEAVAESLEAGVSVRLVAHGSSMRPFLQDGDEIRIVPAPSDRIQLGDIVLVRTSSGAALHRVLSMDLREAVVRTKGDASRVSDAPLPAGAIVGRAEAVWRGVGWVALDTRRHRVLGRFVSVVLSPLEPLRWAARWILWVRARAQSASRSRLG